MLFYSNKTFYIDEPNNICMYSEPCDEYMHMYGLLYCAVTVVHFDQTPVNLIITDSNFIQLDNYIKEFLIQHEIGHIKYSHLSNMTEKKSKFKIILRYLNFLPKMEVEADCFAASIIGKDKAKLALRYFYNNNKLPLISRLECFKRYLRI